MKRQLNYLGQELLTISSIIHYWKFIDGLSGKGRDLEESVIRLFLGKLNSRKKRALEIFG